MGRFFIELWPRAFLFCEGAVRDPSAGWDSRYARVKEPCPSGLHSGFYFFFSSDERVIGKLAWEQKEERARENGLLGGPLN